MESFNKNWLAIIIIAVVFFLLGFLLGKVTGFHPMMKYHDIHKMNEISGYTTAKDIQVDVDVDKILEDLDIDQNKIKNDSNKIMVIKKVIK
jgi:hypothetical protein